MLAGQATVPITNPLILQLEETPHITAASLLQGNERRIAIYGTACTPFELMFAMRAFPKVEFYDLYYIEVHPFSQEQKSNLLKYEEILNCKITFIKPEDCWSNMVDGTLCLSTSFRTVSAFRYNAMNEDLKACGIDTRYPIWSDQNNITEFVMSSMNLHKFLLNITNIEGVVIYYPLAIPFNVFAAYEGIKDDFVILDHEAETLWEDTLNARWPSYCTNYQSPYLTAGRNSSYYSGKFVAGE